ncbi:HD domain-containing protein [Enterococcus hulanensis]|uniref:HD domain-containing protein n=1 Tax=Enterococcus hulanensis TaxID=2559929 RepID=A0ABU3EXX6_9ENTE|nr:HD domain-containing protein [Enterococcus hulanensis]MDT2599725.1 HD domain-containing protein [Enterococcus hulanensis]MDT2609419.1 HD domain-containing protein [Enterococcus hulanensis]MDT2615996.1 HD domain-containing protein [Enterococcus hulanensis]MDT2627964.1 HD domain-containing protein [Enterococcus hulanensis]MDT2655069.1 HD domain-containing protein [Enterococcus hulanensis]
MQNNKIEAIRNYAKEKLGDDRSGHDFYHVERVAKIAAKLAEQEGVPDTLIIETASYLHDVIDDKIVADVDTEKESLKKFLKELDFSADNIQEIFEIIENISFSQEIEKGKANLTIAGKIVQDADRIDALGAIGILRTAYYGGHTQSPLYDPNIQPQEFKSKQDYRKKSTVINHFYEKLFKLPATMNTQAGKLEAQRREAFMENFLETFYAEWDLS